jgi:hypothetical protein
LKVENVAVDGRGMVIEEGGKEGRAKEKDGRGNVVLLLLIDLRSYRERTFDSNPQSLPCMTPQSRHSIRKLEIVPQFFARSFNHIIKYDDDVIRIDTERGLRRH